MTLSCTSTRMRSASSVDVLAPQDSLGWLVRGFFNVGPMGVRTLVGAAGGQVVTAQTAVMYIGAETCSNKTAEHSSVVVALWLLLGILTHQPLHVWPDSKYTIDMVEGRCRPVMHCKLFHNARQIVNMHRSHHGLRFTHVRSHTNSTANEFADRVADLARRGFTINVVPDIVPVSPAIPCHNPLVFQCAVPSPVVDADDDACAVSFWISVEFQSVDPRSWKRSVPPVSHATRLTCITTNVLTMQETRSMPSASERGCDVSGRRAGLQLEFALPDASIVGLQETRSKKAFARKSDAFFMVASAATKAGTDGCELWVATSLKPSSSTVRPIISKPSMLVVALRPPFAQITVMVAHAPVEQQPRNVRDNWWDECLEALMTARVDFSSLVVLIDANARLGSLHS